ncbi:hypothetical protein AK812_SmicGene47361, partial [Symbiodinium microadriaticum]
AKTDFASKAGTQDSSAEKEQKYFKLASLR